ncbi:hypothetical protein TWF718_005745 [Orbilia javanica]|uniref:Uncharacterized protein n=1 Tax=Orbilia javanica TaxID=47235 RepID=A0AAN8N880_9PEZI
MAGGLNKRPTPEEKPLNSNGKSTLYRRPHQRDGSTTGASSNSQNFHHGNVRDDSILSTAQSASDGKPSSKEIFTFTSPQNVNVDFQYQPKNTTSSLDMKNCAQDNSSGQDTTPKVQASPIRDGKTSRRAPSGVNVALEDAILLDDNYVLPRGPKLSNQNADASKKLKVPVPPSKKLVKFALAHNDDSPFSSFDSLKGPSGENLRTKSYIRVIRKKKKQSFASSAVAHRAYVESRECVLTPSALVELEQLKLRDVEKDEQIDSIEEQLLEATELVQSLQERVKALEVECSKNRQDLEALAGKKNIATDEPDEDDESEKRLWKIQRICNILIAVIVIYLVIAYWAT